MAKDEGSIQREQFVVEHAHRPAVGHNVMDR